MAKVQNVSGSDRIVGERLVVEGATLECERHEVWSYTCSGIDAAGEQVAPPVWAPFDDEAKAVHEAEVAALVEAAAEPPELAKPAGNAAREVWAEYVIAAGLAVEDDITDMSRDQLRDTYGQEG